MIKPALFFLTLLLFSCSYSYLNKTYNQREYFSKAEDEYYESFPENDQFSNVDTNSLTKSTIFKYQKVTEKHTKLLTKHPKTSFKRSSFILNIKALYRLNLWGKVIGETDRFLKNYPDDEVEYEVLYFQALSYLYSGNEPEAMRVFAELEKYKKGESYLVNYYETLADVWINKGSTSKAMNYLKKALSYAKDDKVRFRLYKKMGIQYSLLKKFNLSNDNYDSALGILSVAYKEKYDVLLRKSNNFLSSGKEEESVALLKKIIVDINYSPYKDTVAYTMAEVGRLLKSEEIIFDGVNTMFNSRGIFLQIDTIFSPERDSLYENEDFKNHLSILEKGLVLYADFQYDDVNNYETALFSYRYLRRVFYQSTNKEYYSEQIEKCRKIMRLARGVKRKDKNYAKNSYEYGEYLLLDLQQSDSAFGVFKGLANDSIKNTNPRFYTKAVFAMAYILLNDKDTLGASPYLDSVMSVSPYSQYSKEAAKILGKPFILNRTDSLNYELDLAENFVINEEFREAIDKYTYIENEERFKNEKMYYKSLIGKAYIFEEKIIRPDSAFIYYSIVDSMNIDNVEVRDIIKLKLKNKERNEKLMEIQ